MGTREAQRLNGRIGGNFRAERPTGTGDHIEHARRQTRLGQNLGQLERHGRGLRGGLEHDCVSAQQRRHEFPGRNGDGEIPRSNERHHTQRFTTSEQQIARQIVGNGLSTDRVTQAAKKPEDIGRPLNLAGGLGQRLTLFTDKQQGQIGLAGFENLRGLAEKTPTRHRCQRRPGRKRLLGRGRGRRELRRVRQRIASHRLPGVRRIGGCECGSRCGRNPVASDEIGVVLHGLR